MTADDTGVVANWTVTVTATNFTTGAAAPAQTIAKGGVSYWSGPATAKTGTELEPDTDRLGASRRCRGAYTGTVTHSVV